MSTYSAENNKKFKNQYGVNFNKTAADVVDKLEDLRSGAVTVIGDLGIDEYVYGDVYRISPEAPVPVLEATREEHKVGLAGNVVSNLTQMGASEAQIVSIAGDDSGASWLKSRFAELNVGCKHLITDKSRPTIRKTRFLQGHHHLVRVDYEDRSPISEVLSNKVVSSVQEDLKSSKALILEDYAKGLLSESICQKVIELAHNQNKPVFVDPHSSTPLSFYSNADFITPNKKELCQLLGREEKDTQLFELPSLISELKSKTGIKSVISTLGPDGLFFSGPTAEESFYLPTIAREVYDVTGAGDTFIAAFSLAHTTGFTNLESCFIANAAAGYAVGQVGCVACSFEELKNYIKSFLA